FGTSILAIDYAGTLTAAILFPLVLLPSLPLFGIAGAVAGINALIAIVFLIFSIKAQEKISKLWLPAAGVLLAIYLVAIFNAEALGKWAVQTFYIGGGA